eukprot:TRINITY_DN22437_c0_g1_i1.p1 TRINITY_DN22437_c0_g1~~TRINITY_DN22437_c0_g1_i1.p1  ORF type:complete len:490 (+),score=79.83 TRINITY_DN22437_c0_g1_i1:166-1635(+)
MFSPVSLHLAVGAYAPGSHATAATKLAVGVSPASGSFATRLGQSAYKQRRDATVQRMQMPPQSAAFAAIAVALGIRQRFKKRFRRWCQSNAGLRSSLAAWNADDSCELPPDFDDLVVAEAESPPQVSRVALVLNRNAKGVSSKMERKLREIIGPSNCFDCCTLGDARHAIGEVLDRGYYSAIACGGGDGTIASVINLLRAAAKEKGQEASLPALCVLRLGTGNALAYVVGARYNPARDLQKLVGYVTSVSQEVPLLTTKLLKVSSQPVDDDADHDAGEQAQDLKESNFCFFAGLGYDARMLKDYNWLRTRTKNRLLRRWIHSPLGYVIALIARTLPATMRGEHVFRIRVTNLADKAYVVDPRRGDWVLPAGSGDVLYDGEAGIASFGAVPFYGGGFHLFPFAGLHEGLAHLRLSNIHPVKATLNLVPLWWGTYRNAEKVKDFLFEDVLIEVDQPTPLQHSGELMSDVRRVRVQVQADGSTQLVDFLHGP